MVHRHTPPHAAYGFPALFLAVVALFACLAVAPRAAEAQQTFTYRAPVSRLDTRHDYERELLRLVLEKTTPAYGPYLMLPSPPANTPRLLSDMRKGVFETPMFQLSATGELCAEFTCIPFPVDLGIVGYRIFFASPHVARDLGPNTSKDELKTFVIGQGLGWQDVKILRADGFTVNEYATYDQLFRMVAAQRFDLLPRGANEIKQELEAFGNRDMFIVEKHLALYYPLPRFFVTTPGNEAAAERVMRGLVMAHGDGSLLALWKRHFGPSVEFARLRGRTIFRLDNPDINGIDPSYEQYLFDPDMLGQSP